MPNSLMEENNLDRVPVTIPLLFPSKKEPSLERNFKGNEKRILYDSSIWNSVSKKFVNVPVAKSGLQSKHVLQFVWRHCKDIIHSKLLPASENMTTKKYCDKFANLNVALKEKRSIPANWKCVIFRHDKPRNFVTVIFATACCKTDLVEA